MSSIHPFSQAGFWDFVASLRDRQNPAGQAAVTSNAGAMDRPRRGRRAHGRRARNAIAATDPVAPLTEMDPAPFHSVSDDNEKALPPQYLSLPHQAEAVAVSSDNEKTAADVMLPRGGKKGGRGRRQMRKVAFEDGTAPSDEELATRAERRRLRREAAGKGTGHGPRARRLRKALAAEQDVGMENKENTVEGEIPQKHQQRGGNGPRGLRRRRIAEVAPGPRSMQPDSEKLVDVSSDEKTTGTSTEGVGRRGGRRGGLRGRGAHGMKEARRARLEGIIDHVHGGPRKFAAVTEEGANPSNGKKGRKGNGPRGQKLGPRARKMAAFRQQAELYGFECPNCGRSDVDSQKRFQREQRKEARSVRREMRRQSALTDPQADARDGNAIKPTAGTASVYGKRHFTRENKKFGPKKLNRGLKNKNGNKKNGTRGGKKFKPRADVYATEGAYHVYLPVPGASQKDIAVLWDAKKSALRIAGIIQRPDLQQVGADANLVRAQREVGSFKRVVKLGKKHQEIKVYENGITANLEDGILKVEVPKYDGDETTSDAEFVQVKESY